MTLIAFVSARSPGLTTTVHALAAGWPAPRRCIVAELNPEGGSLGARHDLPPEPGLTTLAAAGRRGLTSDRVLEHCCQVRGGPIVLLGPMAPDQMSSALSVLGPHLAAGLDSVPGTDVLADCGRIHSASPALGVIRSAARVVMVVTPSVEGVAYAQSRLDGLGFAAGRVGLITVGDTPYPPDQVGSALELPVLGAIALDRRGAHQLEAGRGSPRSGLMRSAARLAAELTSFLPTVAAAAQSEPRPRHRSEHEARAGAHRARES